MNTVSPPPAPAPTGEHTTTSVTAGTAPQPGGIPSGNDHDPASVLAPQAYDIVDRLQRHNRILTGIVFTAVGVAAATATALGIVLTTHDSVPSMCGPRLAASPGLAGQAAPGRVCSPDSTAPAGSGSRPLARPPRHWSTGHDAFLLPPATGQTPRDQRTRAGAAPHLGGQP
jgi:hypothetical protein